MNIWEWIAIALFIVAVAIGVRVLLLELRFKQIENSTDNYKKWLLGHINRAKWDLKIVTEYLCPCVFNDVTDEIKNKLSVNSDFRVNIITGQIIYRDSGTNKLHELVTEGNFGDRLNHDVVSDGTKQDFTLVDNKHVYLCEPHNPVPRPTGLAIILERNPSYAQQFRNKFDKIQLGADKRPRLSFKDYDQDGERD